MLNYAGLMTKAAQLRQRLGEDNNSPVDIFSLAMNIEKLTIVHYPMGINLSGMCIKGRNGKCVIAINSSMTLGRQRFSLAHELYHLFYDDNMVSVCAASIGNGKGTEREADAFASYFLMPDAELETKAEFYAKKHENGKLDLQDLIRLEQYFQVSHQAMVIRLKQCSYMDTSKIEEFMHTSVRHKAEAMGYSPDLYKALPEAKQYGAYGYYIEQAEQVLTNELVSDGKYEEILLDGFRPDLVYGVEEGGDIID